jgi:ferric-dicitrate binding protein FerR (iron transport regulator)
MELDLTDADRPSDADRELAEHAAQWLVMLIENEMRPTAQQDFTEWLKASPRHAEEFLLSMAVWMQLDALDPQHSINLKQLLSDAGNQAV